MSNELRTRIEGSGAQFATCLPYLLSSTTSAQIGRGDSDRGLEVVLRLTNHCHTKNSPTTHGPDKEMTHIAATAQALGLPPFPWMMALQEGCRAEPEPESEPAAPTPVPLASLPPCLGIADLDPGVPEPLKQAVHQHATCALAVDLPLERHAIRCLFAEIQPYPQKARRGVVGMGPPLAAKSAVVADAGLSWVALREQVLGLMQWGDSSFCLLGAAGVSASDLSDVVDYAVRFCVRKAPTSNHVAVCSPTKVAGFWYEVAYLPPHLGWPADEVDRLLMRLSQDTTQAGPADAFPALPPPKDPPVIAVIGGPATTARLLARTVAHRLCGYVAVNELSSPAGGVPCVVVLDGDPAIVALQRLLASTEAVYVQPPPGIVATVVRVSPEVQQAVGDPNLAFALQAAHSVIVMQPRDQDQPQTRPS